MRRRASTPLAAVLLLLAATTTPAAAQCGSGAGNGGSFGVSIAPAAVTFPSPTAADFNLGYVDQSGVSVTVTPPNGGRTWYLCVRAGTPDLGGYGKPLSTLLWRPSTSASWTPITTTDQLVTSQKSSASVVIYFRVALAWAADVPGSYGTPVLFTASF